MISKKLILSLFTAFLLATTTYATEAPQITITDITEQQTTITTTAAQRNHYPIEISTTVDEGLRLICKTFEVSPDTSPDELVEENLTQSGVKYALQDILKRQLPNEQETKSVSQTVTADSDSDKQADILQILQPNIAYNENSYTGELRLDESSIKTEVASTTGYKYAVTNTQILTGLNRNDPYLIPKTAMKNGLTLSLCNVDWSGGNENEPSPNYTATAYYKGFANGIAPSGYTITAKYSGDVTKTTTGNVLYTLVYAEIQAPPIELPQQADYTALWVTLGGVFVCGTAFGLLFLLRKNKVCNPESEVETAEPPKKEVRMPMALSRLDSEEEVDE